VPSVVSGPYGYASASDNYLIATQLEIESTNSGSQVTVSDTTKKCKKWRQRQSYIVVLSEVLLNADCDIDV